MIVEFRNVRWASQRYKPMRRWRRVSPLSFSISADGTTWTTVVPSVVMLHGDGPQSIYSLQGLSGVTYVKILWNNTTGQSWNPSLGAVNMLS